MSNSSRFIRVLVCSIGITLSYQAAYAEAPIDSASGSLSTSQELTLSTVIGAAAIGAGALALAHHSDDHNTNPAPPPPPKPIIKWEATGAALTGGTVNALLAINGKVYAGTNVGVAVSTDNGAHWSLAFPCPKVLCLVADQDNNVYAASKSGVIVYNNRKQAWITPDPQSIIMKGYNSYVNVLIIDPKGVVYAGTRNGIYFSKDQGKTWSATTSAFTDEVLNFATYSNIIYAVTKDSSSNINVYTSTDGSSWTSLLTTPTSYSSLTPNMVIDSSGKLYLGLNDGIHVYSSTNGWTTLSFNNSPVYALAKNPGNDIYAGVTTNGTEGVYVCKLDSDCSSFSSWNPADPTAALASKNINAFIFNTAATKENTQAIAYAAANDGVYTYDGKTWNPPASSSSIFGQAINVLALDATNVYAGSNINGVYYASKTDLTNNWVSTKNNITAVKTLLRPLVQGKKIFVFSNQGLTTYDEGSKEWSVNNIYQVSNTKAAAIDDKTNLYAGTSTLYYSNDQGATWTATNVKNLRSLLVDQNGNVFAGTTTGVYSSTSTDPRNKWKQTAYDRLTHATIISLAADYNNGSSTIFAGADSPSDSTNSSGIFIKNGDSEWQSSFNTTDSVKQLLVDTNKHYIYATIAKSSNFDATQIYLYKDNTWNLAYSAPEGITVTELFIDPTNSNLYITPFGNGLLVSKDNAHTFTAVQDFAALNVNDITIDPNNGYIYAGTLNGVYLSKDHGATWTQENSGLDNTAIGYLFFNSSDKISASTFGGPVYQGSVLTSLLHKTAMLGFSPMASAAVSSTGNRRTLS